MSDELVTSTRQMPFPRAAAAARDERGQATPEYALVMALLAAACVGAMTLLGTQISDLLTAIANAL